MLGTDEAFFLRSRMVSQREKELAKETGQAYRKISAENEIRSKGEIDRVHMTDLAQTDPYILERLSQIKEHYAEQGKNRKGSQHRNTTETSQQQSREALARKSLGGSKRT